jgi:hypothetical protein
MQTLNDFFEPSAQELTARLRKAMSDGSLSGADGGVGAVPGSGLFARAIANEVDKLLDVSLGDILIGGWNKAQALGEALRKSARSPGKEILLQLAEHKVSSTHKPYVSLVRNEHEIARVPFTVAVELVVQGAMLRIVDGAIRDIETGQLKGKGSVKCGRAVLIEREMQTIAVPGTIAVKPAGDRPN